MFQPKGFRTFARVTKVLLMLLLIGFELVPRFSNGNMAFVNQTSLQLTRSQIIANDAYALVYRSETERAQALRDLQNVLPPFEQEQMLLLTNSAADIRGLLQQARVDYLPLLAAAKILASNPNATNKLVELSIIISHNRSYLVTMSLLLLISPVYSDNLNIQLFIIQLMTQAMFLTLFLLALATFAWERHVRTGEKKQSLTLKMLISRKAIFVFLLLFLLILLEIMPLRAGKDASYLNQAALQRTRCEIFAKSAFVLAYGPANEKTLALSDIQIVLPLFQQEHATLLADATVHPLVQQTTAEYQTMTTAVQTLSTYSGGPVGPATVDTIVSQTPQCLAGADRIVRTLQDTIQQRINLIFYGEVTIEVVFIVFFAGLVLLSSDPFAPRPTSL